MNRQSIKKLPPLHLRFQVADPICPVGGSREQSVRVLHRRDPTYYPTRQTLPRTSLPRMNNRLFEHPYCVSMAQLMGVFKDGLIPFEITDTNRHKFHVELTGAHMLRFSLNTLLIE